MDEKVQESAELFLAGLQLGGKLCHHFLEFLTLRGVEYIENPVLPGCPQIVELVLKAVVIVAVIVQHQCDFLGLIGGKIQLGFEVLQDGIARTLAASVFSSGRRGFVQASMQVQAHPQGSGRGARREHQQ